MVFYGIATFFVILINSKQSQASNRSKCVFFGLIRLMGSSASLIGYGLSARSRLAKWTHQRAIADLQLVVVLHYLLTSRRVLDERELGLYENVTIFVVLFFYCTGNPLMHYLKRLPHGTRVLQSITSRLRGLKQVTEIDNPSLSATPIQSEDQGRPAPA